jgi:hypothetical protein
METRWAALLATYLDIWEERLQEDLSDPRTGRAPAIAGVVGANSRQLDLMDALDEVTAAREELARCPEGAQLALHVLNTHLHWLRLPHATAAGRDRGGLKGAHAPKPKRTQNAVQRHAAIRQADAEILIKNPRLSPARRAARLAKTFTLSERTIRGIIGK